jgi:peptidyl-dipeptidase A
VSFIVQFQFYESMCIAAGQYDPANPMDKPLYQCDFAGNKAAGLKML